MKRERQRKSNIARIVTIVLFTIILLGTTLISFNNRLLCVYAGQNQEKQGVGSGNTISMSIDYGYNHYAKYGRYMNVSTSIINEGAGFTGWIQVIAPKQKNSAVYRNEVKINANSKQTYSLSIPLVDDTGIIQVKLLDEHKKLLAQSNGKIKIGNYEQQIYIGVLSNNVKELKYLNTLTTRVFNLDESKISEEYTGLDLLDILVIDHYDTSRLNERQLSAIQKWVNQGGTLVIGTGDYSDETLAKLGDYYSIKRLNPSSKTVTVQTNDQLLKSMKQYILNYQIKRKFMLESIEERNKILRINGKEPIKLENMVSDQLVNDTMRQLRIMSVNKNIVNLRLADGTKQIALGNKELLQLRASGRGVVQVFSCDLGLDENSTSLGWSILEAMADNMSVTKKEQLQDEYYGSYYSSDISAGMKYTDAIKVPNVMEYVIILFVYIILVGPISYIILRKLDKRSLTWIVVPVLAVLFTCIVYGIGSGTRINEPFASYVEFLNYQKNDMVEDKLFFGLTAPLNNKYSIDLDPGLTVTNLSDPDNNDYSYKSIQELEFNSSRYMTSINSGLTKTVLEVNNNPAFSPVYYQTQNAYKSKNQLTTDIHYTGNKIYGTVTNGFDYDISNAILVSDGYLVNIGSLKHGETISLEDRDSMYLITRDFFYDNNIINSVEDNGDKLKNMDSESKRKANILTYVADNYIFDNQNEYIIGFADSKEENQTSNQGNSRKDVLKQLSQKMNCYGTKVGIYQVQVNHQKDNKELKSSINPYMKVEDSFNNLYDSYRFLVSNEQTVEYQLPADDHIISFDYLADQNQNYDKDYIKSFNGKISFLNNTTGNFDEVFKSGVGSSILDLKNYLTNENTITVHYTTDVSLQGYEMILPNLSYWKEADTNARDSQSE